jgi:hypothetical protein
MHAEFLSNKLFINIELEGRDGWKHERGFVGARL